MMTAKQFSTIVDDLQLSQAELGALLDLDERQIRRYRTGTTIPKPIAILLWLIKRQRITLADIKQPMRPSPKPNRK